MAFVVASLANYTEENVTQLVASSVLGSKTITLIKDQGNVMLGVKSAETVNIMDTDAFFQDGSSCGFNASGTTTFTQRTLTIGKIKVNEALCPKDLEAKYLQKAFLMTQSVFTKMPNCSSIALIFVFILVSPPSFITTSAAPPASMYYLMS